MTAGWAIALSAWIAAALWLHSRGAALSSDDALFFMNGVTRFSVLDFSPQFPGYPGYILMARAVAVLTDSPLASLGLLNALIMLALPWVAAWVAVRAGGGTAASIAFLLVLTQPLGPDMAQNLLSDGAGVLFVMLFVALVWTAPTCSHPRTRAFVAGMSLGWALACRPTNLSFALSTALGAAIAAPRTLWPVGCGAALVLIPVGAGLLIIEPLYPDEALRFIEGHAKLWGNTALSRADGESWTNSLVTEPTLALILAVQALATSALPWLGTRNTWTARFALCVGFWGHAIWIIGFQNPDNLRHLAPFFVTGATASALVIGQLTRLKPLIVLILGLQVSSLISSTQWNPSALPPARVAADWFAALPKNKDSILITNYGVHLLRDHLNDIRVYDAYYTASTSLAISQTSGPAWQLSAVQQNRIPAAIFPGRHIGERDLFLFHVTPADLLQSFDH